jgi:hypothetical protein
LDLEEKFAQADQRARDLALAKAETLEKLAKAELSKVEAERSKVAASHYQDSMEVDSEEKIVLSQSTVGVLTTRGQPGTHIKISTEESKAIRQSHMVGGSRTAPLGKQQPAPYIFTSPPPPTNEHLFAELVNEIKQSMARVWEGMKEMKGDIQVLKSQNVSRSTSVANLTDTSNLRIGSNLTISEPGSTAVEVMSVTTDEPMDENSNLGPSSSPDNTMELGCSTDDHLLAADSV